MEIEITQVTPWQRAVDAARWTSWKDSLGKEPSDNFKKIAMMSAHSPKRMVEYDIKIKGIPYCTAVHFVRHHVGVEKFQGTLRDDRNNVIDDRRKLPQNYPVNLWLAVNADALVSISLLRLCGKASPETRNVWKAVRDKMHELDPVVARFMVPQCVFRGFCPENPKECCGYVKSMLYLNELISYRNGFTY